MVFKFLINTQYLKFDDSLKDYIVQIPHLELYLLQNGKKREELYYDSHAKADIGRALLATHEIDYPFATYTGDFTDRDENSTQIEIQQTLTNFGSQLPQVLDGMLFYLWFVKDNNVSTDFTYCFTEIKGVRSARLFMNNNTLTMSDCTCNDTVFSKDELLYGISIYEKANEICKNMKGYENNVSDEDLFKGSLNYVGQFRYHNYTRIERALFFLGVARAARNILYKITCYVNVIESLFSTQRADILNSIRQRVALYMGSNFEGRTYISNFIKEIYDVRSAYVHSSAIYNKEKKETSIFSKDNLLRLSKETDDLLRATLLRIIFDDADIFQDDNKLNDLFNRLIFDTNTNERATKM